MSDNEKHTPGPWQVDVYVVTGATFVEQVGGPSLAHVLGKPGPLEPYIAANARLIAAAPDLLAACKVAFEAFGSSFATDHDKAMALVQLETARRKAEGI